MKYSFISFLFLFSVNAFSAECHELFYTKPDARTYKAYYTDTGLSAENCYQMASTQVVMDSLEYRNLKLDADEYNKFYEVNETDIAAAFGWGFGTYIFFWWLGYVIRMARSVIRQV